METAHDIRRIETGHDSAGQSIIAADAVIALEAFDGGAVRAANLFAGFNPVLDDGYVPSAGVAVNVADFPPDFLFPLHQTRTIDFAVVLSGEIELGLDSGETRRIGAGGFIVQRDTNHSWRNTSDGWTRMLFVLICDGALAG
jgi:quercetin dioxygenase-like cupin family protein